MFDLQFTLIKPCHPERKLTRKRQLESKDLFFFGYGAKFQGKSRSFGFAQDDTVILIFRTLSALDRLDGHGARFEGKSRSFGFAQDDTILTFRTLSALDRLDGRGARFQGKSRSFGFAQDDTICFFQLLAFFNFLLF